MTNLKAFRANAILGIAYFAAAAAAIVLTRLDDGVALLWIATAPLLARLIALPVKKWGAPLATCYVAGVTASALLGPLGAASALMGLANIGEAVVGALVLRRLIGDSAPFGSMPRVFATALAAGVVAPIASGAFGSAIAAEVLQRDMGTILIDWTLGHGLGTILCLPLLTCLSRRSESVEGVASRVEIVGLLALVAVVTTLTFGQSQFPLLFLPVLPILIVTFRLGGLGVGFAMMLLALIGGFFTMNGSGPVNLIPGDDSFRLQFFQFYLGITFLIALPIAGELAQRRLLAAALRESERKYRFIVENTTDIVLDVAPDGTIRYASPSIRQIGGFDPDLLVGRNASTLVDPDDACIVRAAHMAALSDPSETFTVEHRAGCADGSSRWFETHTRAVLGSDANVSGVVSAIRDINARKHAEMLLQEAAANDPLTGIANRRTFDRRLDALLTAGESGSPATLAMIDLDHFKAINDCHGHGAGDSVLQAVAAVVRKHIRSTDLVARIGGEEFAILFEGADVDAAHIVCERVRRGLAKEPIRSGVRLEPLFVTASFGLAAITPGRSPSEIARAADEALYEAKAAGRNCLKVAA